MKRLTNKTLIKGVVGLLGIVLIGLIIDLVPLGREMTVIVSGKIGPMATPLLRHALQDEDHNVREAAYSGLQDLGARAVPSLVDALHDKNPRVRAEAVDALAVVGSHAKDALPDLVAAFHDPDESVRIKAMLILRYVDHDAVEILPTLLAISREDPSGRIRAQAVETVGVVGRLDAVRATPVLLQTLTDPDAEVRAESAEALGRLARHKVLPKEAIPGLQEALKDPVKGVRDEASEALAEAGVVGRTAADAP
ncbi:MAG TPA: HEAT repeat domain-containing protein [Gemmataceae bacterium]|nr:HEAT repeat domain-containing protein [Gemmataceae bacterium]